MGAQVLLGRSAGLQFLLYFESVIEDADDPNCFSLDLLSERTVPSYDSTETEDGPHAGGDSGDFVSEGQLYATKEIRLD